MACRANGRFKIGPHLPPLPPESRLNLFPEPGEGRDSGILDEGSRELFGIDRIILTEVIEEHGLQPGDIGVVVYYVK